MVQSRVQSPRTWNQHIGNAGESLAADYLQRRGLRILERNFRARQGEIDIVARDGPVLVFCEVKARTGTEFGPPEYAVTPWKQRQMRRAAAAYLYAHGLTAQECRFDVVAILLDRQPPALEYFRNAFYL